MTDKTTPPSGNAMAGDKPTDNAMAPRPQPSQNAMIGQSPRNTMIDPPVKK